MSDFNQAIKWLEEGKKIRRSGWFSDIFLKEDTAGNIYDESSDLRHYFTRNDFEAKNWETYCEGHDWVCCDSMEKGWVCEAGKLCKSKFCKNCGIKKPKEITLKKRSFPERIAYLKAKFDIGELNESMYKIQIKTLVRDLK